MDDNASEIQKIVNAKYPGGRRKAKTYLIDFQDLETTRKVLNDFEQKCLAAVTINPSDAVRIIMDFRNALNKFNNTEKIIIQKRKEGYTQQEIADLLNKSRSTVIRKINNAYRKLRKIFGTF